MNENKEFKPYIPAEKVTAEMTVTSVIMGVILAIVFGAANAYLGLRVGMTVSASIPAAVISMGVIRVIMKKNSILESNLVQTIGSAGESLAAGAIFTMPALFLWAEEGLCDKPSLVEITLIALCGGILGVLFMVPLRNALIVKEHATLLYPEGTACADVLLAGEEGGANASTVFSGMGLAAVFKFVVDGLKVIPADVSAAFTSLIPSRHQGFALVARHRTAPSAACRVRQVRYGAGSRQTDEHLRPEMKCPRCGNRIVCLYIIINRVTLLYTAYHFIIYSLSLYYI